MYARAQYGVLYAQAAWKMALASLAASYASSSDDDDEEAVQQPSKKQRTASADAQPSRSLPPPPLDDDDAASHSAADGRVRQVPHVEGQFAVHVYMPIRSTAALSSALAKCVSQLGDAARSIDAADLHLSLSKTGFLPRAQIQGFAEALHVALARSASSAATSSSPTAIGLTARPVQLANDTRTRFFAAVELDASSSAYGSLCKLIDAIDAVFARYGQPRFYEERRLHFSFAWSLKSLPTPLPSLPPTLCSLELSEHVEWRIGERVTQSRVFPPR